MRKTFVLLLPFSSLPALDKAGYGSIKIPGGKPAATISLIQSPLKSFRNSGSQLLLLGFGSTHGFLLKQEAEVFKSFQKIHLMGLPV